MPSSRSAAVDEVRQPVTQPANAGIIPGIKVDIGAKDLACRPNEKITEGLDGLRDRLKEYLLTGARFAKWRAVIIRQLVQLVVLKG